MQRNRYQAIIVFLHFNNNSILIKLHNNNTICVHYIGWSMWSMWDGMGDMDLVGVAGTLPTPP